MDCPVRGGSCTRDKGFRAGISITHTWKLQATLALLVQSEVPPGAELLPLHWYARQPVQVEPAEPWEGAKRVVALGCALGRI